MNSAKKTDHIDRISRSAMKSQRASFRIEGINISKKKAEEIRREIVQELNRSANP